MADDSDLDLKKRDFDLKAIQAWSEAKYKIATLAIVGNGAAIATALTFIKDKGHDSPSVFALHSSVLGISAAGAAALMTFFIQETAISKVIKRESSDVTSGLEVLYHPLQSFIFAILMLGSAAGFIGGLAYFEGYSDATMMIKEQKLFKK